MKSKLQYLLIGVFLFVSTSFWSQQTSNAILLINAKFNKSINVNNKYNPDKVEALLGKAISLDKDVYDNEAPIFTFKYDGLTIEMQNEAFKMVTITNKNWKLNQFTIGTPIAQIEAKHEKYEAKFVSDNRFKVKDSKAIIFAESDAQQKVTKLGVVFN